MACGEGYGSDVLAGARRRASSASTPTPRPTSTRGCATARPNLRFERDLVESFAEPCDAVVFLQTIEHVQDPGAILEHFKSMLGARRRRLRLDPEPADPGAARGGEVRQPLARAASTGPRSSASSARRTSTGSSCSASSTPASCASTSWRSSSAGTASTSACGLTKPFYDRFTPAIAASDFAPAAREPRRGPGLPRRLPCLSDGRGERRRPGDRPPLATCPTSRASGPTRSARSGCSTR